MNRLNMVGGATFFALLAIPLAAAANDTDLTYGGAPRPLNGTGTVSMQSEVVKLTVGTDVVTVDCRFVFKNNGPACSVRMGFPDEGVELEGDESGKLPPVKSSFNSFKSWVGGKPIRTTLIRNDQTGTMWYAKNVSFPKGATVLVRDRYTVDVGDTVAFSPYRANLAAYVLHTGASWRGPIGRSEVDVTFKRPDVRAPIRTRRLAPIDAQGNPLGSGKVDTRAVYYRGPCKPRASGHTLTFVRTNWRPTRDDDVRLAFGLQGAQR